MLNWTVNRSSSFCLAWLAWANGGKPQNRAFRRKGEAAFHETEAMDWWTEKSMFGSKFSCQLIDWFIHNFIWLVFCFLFEFVCLSLKLEVWVRLLARGLFVWKFDFEFEIELNFGLMNLTLIVFCCCQLVKSSIILLLILVLLVVLTLTSLHGLSFIRWQKIDNVLTLTVFDSLCHVWICLSLKVWVWLTEFDFDLPVGCSLCLVCRLYYCLLLNSNCRVNSNCRKATALCI